MMFDDDDDGVEPQCKAVDEYYFEVTKDELLCFSILPFQFDENDKVENCDSEKKVYLRGVIDKSLYLVHKQVVAWRVGLDCEQPSISVLSSEGSWIKLLSPWKCYKDEISRSILITVQMLHFVRRHHRDKRRLQGRLWDHLTKVFNKLDTKPAMEDLRKHHSLIKLFLERDPALMNLKILHRFIGDITKTSVEPRASGTKVQFTGSDEPCPRNSDTDSDYDDDEDSDSYDNNDDYNSDADTKNDVDTDLLCALCDDGGNLLSCIGQCKRSFHPRKKDGRESKCKTLGYTSAQLKEIDSYLCKNCECEQHQCFKCRELEPSSEPNAKVFKCNNPTCGHFYHPKCVATLLEPEDADGSCELAKKIMAGMSFTCPVHWCFECGRMEDRAQRAMQFAVCRRCPKSYHRECLPREISFETKDKNIKQRAWKLSGIVIIYCLDHKICRHTGNAERGHIKFPNTPKITEVRDLAKRKGKMVGKQKRSADQCSKKSTKVLNRLPAETIEHTQNSLEHMVLEPECSARNLKEDLQIEPYIVGPACRSGQKALKGQNRKFGSSLSSVMGIKTPASVVGSKTKNRTTSGPKKERSSRTSCNITKTCVDHSAQIADKLHAHMQPIDTDNLMNNPPVNNNTELDNQICRIPEDKDGNGKEKLPEHSGEPEEDATNKDTSHEDKLNAVLGKTFVVIHAGVDQSKFKSSAERGTELGENADGHDSISREISMGEYHMCRGMCELETRSGKGKIARSESAKSGSGNSAVTPDHVDDNPPEKLLHIARVDKMAITDKLHTQPEYDCDKDREVNGVSAFQEEPNSSWCNVNPELMGTHNSEEKSRKRRKLKKKAADGNNIDLDKNSRCNPTEDGKKAHCDESSYRCPSNHKELDYQDRKFGNSEPSGSHMQPGDMDNLMDNPDNNAELDNKICKVPEFKGAKGKEKSSVHPGEPEEDTTNKDISHEDERNAVVGKIFVDIHAEVDQSKFKSSAERSMGLGENADGHDSISGQVISMGENQLCQSMCEKESRSGKGKIARKESPKSGSDNDVVTPDHSHCYPPKRLLSAPHVDKMAIADRLHTQSEYCCDKDREVNWGHEFQEEPNGSQCNVNPKVMGIHTSDDKSRKRRKLKKKAADGNNTDSDKTRRCINIKDGKEAHCDAISHQCSPNHEELDYQDRKFGNNGCSGSCYNDENGTAEVSESRSRQSTEPSRREILTLSSTRENSSISPINRNSQEKPRNHSPNRQRTYEQLPAANEIQDRKFGNSATNGSRCNDENSAAEISEYNSRLSNGPSRREIFTLNTRGSSYNSPMGRNSQKKPRNYSPNRQRTYRYMCEQHIATNEHRYEQWHNVSYPSNGHGPRSHVPLQPVFAPTDFDAHQWHGHHSYPRGLEHGITEWRSPCFYPGSQGYFTGGWQSTYCPGRPENLDYSRNANDLPIRGYDERDNFMHGGYRTMGFDPAAMYSPHQNSNNSAYQPRTDVNMEGCGTAYGGQLREYGATSNYTLGFEPWRPAAGSVMDRYAPHLEQTNDRRRG